MRYYVLADFVAESLSDATGIDVDKRLIPSIPLCINVRFFVNMTALVIWFKLCPHDILITLGAHLGFFAYRNWDYLVKALLAYRMLNSQGLSRVCCAGSLLTSFLGS